MEKNEFKIVRIFNAPRELVFRAWTDPKYVMQWWGPENFTCPYCKIDFRVGGEFHYCMRAPNGDEYWNKGTYREIVVPEKIVSVMYFSDKGGNILPSSHHFGTTDFPSEMVDTVTFEVHEKDKTKLTLTRNHSEEIAKRHGEIIGWNQSLDRLAKALR